MKTRLPKLCRNKLRNAAFVYCGKRKIYLGEWGAPETVTAFRAASASARFCCAAISASSRSTFAFSSEYDLTPSFSANHNFAASAAFPEVTPRIPVIVAAPIEFAENFENHFPTGDFFGNRKISETGRRSVQANRQRNAKFSSSAIFFKGNVEPLRIRRRDG